MMIDLRKECIMKYLSFGNAFNIPTATSKMLRRNPNSVGMKRFQILMDKTLDKNLVAE